MNHSVLKNKNQKTSKFQEKLKNAFSLKIFRYSLIKMLKSPSTYVLLAITMVTNAILVLAFTGFSNSGSNLNNAINEQLTFYLWIFFIFYFSFTAMYIGFKSVQIIRDELDDGTLLIMASLPITRFKMIFEKWLSLQLICLGYAIIVLFIPPLFGYVTGELGQLLTNAIYSALPYMFLTAIIIQFLLSSVAILLSLIIGSKGVIGILFILGFLSLIGALGPFIYNVSNNSNPSSIFLSFTSDSAKKKISLNSTNKNVFKNMTDIRGWDIWNLNSDGLTLKNSSNWGNFSLKYDLTNINKEAQKIIAEKPNVSSEGYRTYILTNASTYPLMNNLVSDHELTIDNVSLPKYSGGQNFTILENDNLGINLLSNFYENVKTKKPVTLSWKNNVVGDLGIKNFDTTNITTPEDKAILQLMNEWYQKELFTPNSKNYSVKRLIDLYDISKQITGTTFGNLFDLVSSSLNPPYESNNSKGLYFNDLSLNTIHYFTNNLISEILRPIQSFGKTNNDIDNVNKAIDKIKKQELSYRLMGYLNIWQQWMVMWTGNKGTNGFLPMLPLNNFLTSQLYPVKYQSGSDIFTTYSIGANFAAPVEIVNLPVMISVYTIFSLGIAALSVWSITRKDFV
ncbi:hypothetical protein SSYRP_v1c03570 [Spiroplasma syrphidicola EA-1]|uniref:Uncharacterized protein n=1 Tax=Spiroplasma syrphidicola EA-1 TaxID=1276229 RepID=R4UL17_9MOLU|nr:ABC transporter permease [Spiroplasma syrphidicola]AGM25951.1 hypothetical protein SSYRP_v1c03570 [Spiroplasma syrphidicola EA-1]